MNWSAISEQTGDTERIHLTSLRRVSENSISISGDSRETSEVNIPEALFVGHKGGGAGAHISRLKFKTLQYILLCSLTFNCVLAILFILFYSQLRSAQSSLGDQVGRLGRSVKSIRSDISAIQDGKGLACDFWSGLLPHPMVSLGCGGLITLPENLNGSGGSLLLEYKSAYNETHSSPEHCLWTVGRGDGGRSFRFKVRITLLCDDYGHSHSHLSIVEWDVTTGLSAHPLKNETDVYRTDELVDGLFLSLDSQGLLTSRTDLILKLDVLEMTLKEGGSEGHSFDYSGLLGSGSFGPYRTNDTWSLAVSPPEGASTVLTLHFYDSDLNNRGTHEGHCAGAFDSLEILEIREGGMPNLLDRLCSSVTSALSYTTDYPLLGLLYTVNSTSGRGFGLSWKFVPHQIL